MFFEGSEKKLEIIFKSSSVHLKNLPRSFWDRWLNQMDVHILSSIENSSCDAYLLSESSLFVYEEKLVLITCGRQSIVPFALSVIEEMGIEHIEQLFFQRKNERFPQLQNTAFQEDIAKLSEWFDGKAFRFGQEPESQIYYFSMIPDQPVYPANDATFELLMHQIDEKVSREITSVFIIEGRDMLKAALTQLSDLASFQFDDFVFEPNGYCLNGIAEDRYLTIHLSPQVTHSFVSFETNLVEKSLIQNLTQILADFFKPKFWQIVLSHTQDLAFEAPQVGKLKYEVSQKFSNGYNVSYFHYQEISKVQTIEEIALPEGVVKRKRVEEAKVEPTLQNAEWIFEETTAGGQIGFKVKQRLYDNTVSANKVELCETVEFGKALFVNSQCVLTENDEFAYHEMLSHVPLNVHPNPQKVLIIGGADMGLAREVLKHASVEICTLVNQDQEITKLCQDYFDWVAPVVQDSRVEVVHANVDEWLESAAQTYDVVLVDPLYLKQDTSLDAEKSFYIKLKKVLNPGAIVVAPSLHPVFHKKAQLQLKEALKENFSKVYFYHFTLLSQLGGLCSLAFASDLFNPIEDFEAVRAKQDRLKCQYYTGQIHCASFFLPASMM